MRMEHGRSPSLLILGELILGLDARAQLHQTPFRGSRIILQVWLQERLGLVNPPRSFKVYSYKGFTGRKTMQAWSAGHTEGGWHSYLDTGQVAIRWIVPWWHISGQTEFPFSSSTQVMQILSLRDPVYIYPGK